MQLFARRGKVLEQFDLAVEVEEKGLVGLRSCLGIGRQHLVHELAGRLALVLHGARQAAAGVHQQSKAEGQVRLPRKALDGLRTAILGEREIALLQGGDQCAFFVAHRDRKHDFARFHLQAQCRLIGRGLLGLAHRQQARESQHG